MQNHSRRFLLDESEKYVSRAAYKLESISDQLVINFKGSVVLDVGSSTGGFSDYALKHGAKKVIAVEKGTKQMDEILKLKSNLELHEKTDIRDFICNDKIDLVLIDLSFVSLREIMPSIKRLANKSTIIIAMVKPQFETNDNNLKQKGVIKNERIRRQILSRLEDYFSNDFIIISKADSHIPGVKGNKERFYKLKRSK